MELTVRQAVYALLSASPLDGTPLQRYLTAKTLVQMLDKFFRVRISRRYARTLLGEIAEECPRSEHPRHRKPLLPVSLPREKIYKLDQPGKILTARKWKRHGARRQESNRSSQDRVNAS